MPDAHTHAASSSRRDSSPHGRPQHAGASGGPAGHDVILESLAAQHRSLRRMDSVRHGVVFQMMPRGFRQRYSNELRRRGDQLAQQYGQRQGELAQEQALAQGPFAPGEVYEYIHHSRWAAVAESEQLTDVKWSEWAQGLLEEESQDPEQAGKSDKKKKRGKKKKKKKDSGRG
ncbi:hypothetical protein H634G_09822 [Metarhizium anisopliae BRIP 53293]|uniref:Uncharacterized protein n=1 Tax=Metarhizium anisopliae BRIP 53293 TaxID=1291518 RepID=A0A0D9NLY6_METAN|nr:hypothetical protein H634G_09822 [Metarhizium anisopliae BRIP 53293]KJK86114.1 hypothetical protein H633G_10034 [Metarhizium anisopliae BRIP 53284]